MAKVVIAELDIDITALLKSTSDLKKEIDALKNTQKDLAASGDKSSEAFVQNEAVLKSLNSAYASNVKVIQESGQATKTQADQAQLLNLALTQESTSIAEARQQNQMLNKLRNETNVTTVEGKAQLEALNKKLDENNAFIKNNSDAYAQQKINIGNYSSITKDLSGILQSQGGIFNSVRTQVEGFRSSVSGSVDTVKSIHSSVVSATSGLIGFKTAQETSAAVSKGASAANVALATTTEGVAAAEGTATVATGSFGTVLGAVLFPITAIIAVGLLLYNIFKDFGPIINPIKDSFKALGSVFTVLKSAIFDLVTGAKSLSEIFSSLGSEIADTAKETYKLEAAQRSLTKAMNAQELASARTSTKVKELILQSKDLSKTTKEREALLTKAQQLEEGEFQNRLKLYKQEKEIAIAKLTQGRQISDEDIARIRTGDFEYAQSLTKKKNLNKEELENLRQVLIKRESLLQEDNQIQEKAQNYKNKIIEKGQAAAEKALEKEQQAAEKAQAKSIENQNKAIEAELAKSNIQIELFKTTESAKQKTALETADFNKKLYEKETANLQLQFDKGKISKEQYELEKLQLSQSYAKQQADTLLQFANAELNLFLETNKSKLIGAETLTAELIAEEEKRLKLIEQKRIENLAKEKQIDVAKIEAKKLNNEALTIAELEFETERVKISSETDATIQANKKTLEDQIKVQKAEQLAIDKEVALAEAETKAQEDAIKAEADYQTEMERLNKLLTDKKVTQEQFDALKASADKKKEENEKIASLNRTAATLQELNKVTAGLESMFGKNKAIASATALINGGLAVTEILKTPSVLPEPAASISRAIQIAGTVATTQRSISQINSSKFEKGGIQEIGGKRHSAGGTKFWGEDGTMFEAEAGEGIGILNRNAFASFMDFNNSNGSGTSTGGFFAGGGIITQGVRPETLNIDSVVDAIASMPAPVVAVEEIQSVGNRYTQVVSGANL